MPYRGEPFVPGQYYHVYNRGAGKQRIFFMDDNYRYLLRLTASYARKYCVAVIAYCLMPNHYHFLLRQETDQPLSKFMNVLFNTYAQAVNTQQERRGTLFEGRFRYKHVSDLGYVLRLVRYVHLNPVKAGLVSCPEDWPHSDYREWVGLTESQFGNIAFVRQQFPTAEEYRAFVADATDRSKDDQNLSSYVWD